MRKQGDWSEVPTQLYRKESETALFPEQAFGEEGGRTVVEPPASTMRVPTPQAARPSIPYLTTRLPTPRSEALLHGAAERRLTLTPLPVANPSSVPVPPLAPITRLTPLAPARARRIESAGYRFIGMIALTGFTLGMAIFYLARAVL
jgi:hypothetical protein